MHDALRLSTDLLVIGGGLAGAEACQTRFLRALYCEADTLHVGPDCEAREAREAVDAAALVWRMDAIFARARARAAGGAAT